MYLEYTALFDLEGGCQKTGSSLLPSTRMIMKSCVHLRIVVNSVQHAETGGVTVEGQGGVGWGGGFHSLRNTGFRTILRATLRDLYSYTDPLYLYMDYGNEEVRGER